MIYVETNNLKEQAFLEEEFSRDGNVFGVPYKKTKPIEQQIETIKFEIFMDKNSEKKTKKAIQKEDSHLMQKIT